MEKKICEIADVIGWNPALRLLESRTHVISNSERIVSQSDSSWSCSSFCFRSHSKCHAKNPLQLKHPASF
jgi:hypothetical protein